MKYVYPAVFSLEGEMYNVSFPDLEGCLTFGEGMADAIKMAEDALALYLYSAEEDGRSIPEPTHIDLVRREPGAIVSLIACDTAEYREHFVDQSVQKTVTLPAWLNTMAEESGISLSAVLQNGLKTVLHLE